MTLLIVLFQIVLPLILLGWLAFYPRRSVLGWAVQAIAIAVLLFALATVAQWALPVWWLPRVYGGLWLVAVAAHVTRLDLSRDNVFPTRRIDWLAFAVSLGLFAVGAWYAAHAVAGRALPAVELVAIANPLGPGRYLVGNGGSRLVVNPHMHTLDTSVERFRRWRGQSYAVDFFGLGPAGVRARGWRPADPSAYAIFGARLIAPCDGVVIAAEGAMPDFKIPEQDTINRLGNHVILRCGEAAIVLAHMRQGSVTVAPRDTVATGDLLGEVGNSGASTEPHLHIHAQRVGTPDAPISGEPLAITIEGRFLVRGDRLVGRDL